MTAQDFCYWLQGFSELNGAPPTKEQWDAIRSHLALVFNKVTPPVVPYGPLPGTTGAPFPQWPRWGVTDKVTLKPECYGEFTDAKGRAYC